MNNRSVRLQVAFEMNNTLEVEEKRPTHAGRTTLASVTNAARFIKWQHALANKEMAEICSPPPTTAATFSLSD